MIRYAFSLLAAASTATVLTTPAAAQVEQTVSGPVVELTINENVMLDPDIANLSAGVTTTAPTAEQAMEQNNVQMERVIAAIEAQGIDDDDIQTSGVSLNAEYDYDQATRQQVFRGYRVSNRVNVTVRNIPRTGRVLDALIRAGATDIGGIAWSVDDPTPAQQQARAAAFATGQARALNYARMAGYANARLLRISENFSAGQPIPMMEQAISADGARNQSMPIRPGQVQTGITVHLTYELVE